MTCLNGKDFSTCFNCSLHSNFDLVSFDVFLLLTFHLMTHNSVFFSNALPLLRSTLIQISHCCIKETFKAILDTAGQANGSKPESLQSVGVFFFFFHPFFPPLCSKKPSQNVFSVVKRAGGGGGIYHSSLSAGKGPFQKDRG